MKFVIVTKEWCDNKGIVIPPNVRQSLDGTKVIFHEDFVKPVLTENDIINSYEHNDTEFAKLLNSAEWTEQTEEINNQII